LGSPISLRRKNEPIPHFALLTPAKIVGVMGIAVVINNAAEIVVVITIFSARVKTMKVTRVVVVVMIR